MIKGALEQNKVLRDNAIDLMGDYPDTSYLPLLQDYFRWRLIRSICHDYVSNARVPFFKAIAVYKNDSSRNILDSLLHRRPIMPCRCDTADIRDQIITAIWNNPCPAYTGLRNEVRDYVIKKERSQSERERTADLLPAYGPVIDLNKDSSEETVRW